MRGKDDSIARLVDALPMRENGWILADHWDADLCAVGIASADAPRRLVYVSTKKMAPGRYYYECESPNGPDVTDFKVTDEKDDVDFDTLLRALTRHLAPPHTPTP